MNTYWACNTGAWITAYSVVVAKDEPIAKRMVQKAFKDRGITVKLSSITLTLVDTNNPSVEILFDGDM